MIKSASYILCVLLGLFMSGCEKVFDVDLSGYVSDAIVFEGTVTNERPPYFFHLTRPAAITGGDYYNYEGIDDAVIVITDVTEGIRDTLQYVKPRFENHVYYDYYNYDKRRKEEASVNGIYRNSAGGLYVTTKLYGIEGHSYSLDIYYAGKHFESDVQKMEPALIITDLKVTKVDLGEKGETFAPCISFINPPGENYYLFSFYPWSSTHFTFSKPNTLFDANSNWRYSILSDEHLQENVVDFAVDDGENAFGYPNGWGYDHSSDSVYVWAQTISKSCYDVFDQMLKQFRTDGGAYTPSPSSITGNIRGGVVYGCFRVSAASEKGIYVGERSQEVGRPKRMNHLMFNHAMQNIFLN
mgnify:FL=1